MVDNYSKIVLTIIALGLWIQIGLSLNLVNTAEADDNYIIQRVLYCIDGSSISGGFLSTYCNG